MSTERQGQGGLVCQIEEVVFYRRGGGLYLEEKVPSQIEKSTLI